MTDSRDTMRWAWRGGALALLLIGWVFIAWQNRFHISAPVVFVCLGYLAVVTTVYNLWHTGATAVASPDDDSDSTWAKPIGARGELEREKRTLLKAIKEAEFDHEMGKLSKHDVDDMVRTYRARAIEVIKELDRLDRVDGGGGTVDSKREQIMREVRARIELDGKSSKKATRQAAKAAAKAEVAAKAAKQPAGPPVVAYGQAKPGDAKTAAAETNAEVAAADAEAAHADSAAKAAELASVEAADAEAVAREQAEDQADAQAEDDDALNADSTTTVEPRRAGAAKEATP